MKKIISVLLALILVTAIALPCLGAEKSNELKFRSDGTFKILQLSDTQDDHYPAHDLINFLKLAIKEADADLIIFTGDLVEDSRAGDVGIDGEDGREGVTVKKNGEIDYAATLANTEKAADAVLSIFQESGIPFALAQGNNDYGSGVKNEDWLKIYSRYSNCLVKDMSDDPDGRIDYNFFINGKDDTPAFNIWITDTGRGGVTSEQVKWYKDTSSAITENNGKVIPSFVFQHIQPKDIGNLFEKCTPFDEGAKARGTKTYRLNKEIASGEPFFAYEPCEATEQFKAWKEQGDVLGCYFGHQHVEGFQGKVEGIELGFTYGCEFAKPGPYGFRLFTLHEDDITNYDNVLYTYEGSVKTKNAKFVLQQDKPYKEFANPVEKIFWSAIYFVKFAVSYVIDLFR